MPILLFLLLFLVSCESHDTDIAGNEPVFQVGEYIHRLHDERYYTLSAPLPVPPPSYPWMDASSGKISLYHFRCKGEWSHPAIVLDKDGEKITYFDCEGAMHHSLPIRKGKEFIYPILIELLNYIQEQTEKQVIITSGYRCPDHNTYIDASAANRTSKHMIGAEVDFYVKGLETQPFVVVDILKKYYQEHPIKKQESQFTEFKRYEKEGFKGKYKPWLNKEVFIKVLVADEGRNLDNSHPYPYINIQVRWDEATKQRVNYSWDQAVKGYYRTDFY